MGVDLGLAFCPGAMGPDTSGHKSAGVADGPWLVTLISWGIAAILCQTK